MSKSLAIAAVLTLVAAPAALAQTTWYVDVSGTPPGAGTPGDPYTSLQYALDQGATVDGDTLLVASGTYTEQIDMGVKTVEVRSTDGPLATSIVAPAGMSGFTVSLDGGLGSSNALFEGFSVIGNPVTGSSGVQLIDGAVLRDCVVRGHYAGALGFGNGVQGYLFGSRVESCTILDNGVGAVDHGHFGDLYLFNTVVAHNGTDIVEFYDVRAEHSIWMSTTASITGFKNLVEDPRLWNPAQGDARLGPLSPCIDTGSPSAPLDPDGSVADRGAVPYDVGYLPPIQVYCTSKLNSGGCQAAISTKGGLGASVSSSVPFRVEAVGVVENVPGILFYGVGRRAVPFLGGFHCVEPPTTRTPALASGTGGPTACQGLFTMDFNAWLATPLGGLIEAGTVIDAQWWYRDPDDPLGFASATSDAIEFPVGL